MFAFFKKLFAKPAKAEEKVNAVIARAEASNVKVRAVKKPRAKAPAAKTKSPAKKTKSAG